MRASGIPARVLLLAVPLALLALAALDLVARGAHGVRVVATNLPPPPVSQGVRVVDLVHPTAPEGRAYRIEVIPDTTATDVAQAHVQLHLSSAGKTRLLVVEPDTADASRARGLLSAMVGRATLQLVDDRGWVDLGALPADGAPLRVQVLGLLPGSFAFAELDRVQGPSFGRIAITLATSERSVVKTAPRWRLVRDAPVAPRETLARLVFFASASRLLLVCALVAVVLLVAGWIAVSRAHVATGVAFLVTSVTLLHAVLLPPLQGADETSQVGTIEWLVSDPSPTRAWRYPESIALVSRPLIYDRVQFHPREPLPIPDADARARLRALLQRPLESERTQAGTPPPAADLQVTSWRAPLFYAAYRVLGGGLLALPVGDRIFAYRLAASLSGLAGFAAGLALLARAALPRETLLAYGLAFLLPYVVATSATCSNYAPAIGLGFLAAAGMVTMVLGASVRHARSTGTAATIAAAWLGVPLWQDFAGLAAVATAAAVAAAVRKVLVRRARVRSALEGVPAAGIRPLLMTGALVTAAALVAWWNLPEPDARLGAVGGAWRDLQLLPLRVALIAGPLVAALLCGATLWRLGAGPLERHRRVAAAASGALALLVVVQFAVTPYAEVPYEKVFLPLPDLVRAHLASFWASNLSFDQDRLGWKFLFGTFGWHDTFYPEAVYALARWASVAFVVALPLSTIALARRRPIAAGLLVATAGMGVSLCAASLLVRHALSVHPHGRFILPWLPLVTVPLLAAVAVPERHRVFVLLLRAAVALNVWTAIVIVGGRYALAG